MYKSGYIAIIGRPNVGKSTLLNAFLGQKIAAVSPKPQMTRHKILGIKTLPKAQLLFLDTPGIHKPHRSLNEYMMEVARSVLNDADLFLFLIEPRVEKESVKSLSDEDLEIHRMISQRGKPIIVVLTKLDQTNLTALEPLIEECHQKLKPASLVSVSALRAAGLVDLEREILEHLPEGPTYFPDDQVTDQSERFLVSEIIREKIMDLTQQEVPYSVTILIESFEEPVPPKKITIIRAAIITERDSQKAILIGKGGSMIKKIGELARKEIEETLGSPVYLELFVRVEKEWSKDPKKIKEFGYIA